MEEQLSAVYSQKDSSLKLSLAENLPVEKFDCLIVTTPPEKWWITLESKIETPFNLIPRQIAPKVATIVRKSN